MSQQTVSVSDFATLVQSIAVLSAKVDQLSLSSAPAASHVTAAAAITNPPADPAAPGRKARKKLSRRAAELQRELDEINSALHPSALSTIGTSTTGPSPPPAVTAPPPAAGTSTSHAASKIRPAALSDSDTDDESNDDSDNASDDDFSSDSDVGSDDASPGEPIRLARLPVNDDERFSLNRLLLGDILPGQDVTHDQLGRAAQDLANSNAVCAALVKSRPKLFDRKKPPADLAGVELYRAQAKKIESFASAKTRMVAPKDDREVLEVHAVLFPLLSNCAWLLDNLATALEHDRTIDQRSLHTIVMASRNCVTRSVLALDVRYTTLVIAHRHAANPAILSTVQDEHRRLITASSASSVNARMRSLEELAYTRVSSDVMSRQITGSNTPPPYSPQAVALAARTAAAAQRKPPAAAAPARSAKSRTAKPPRTKRPQSAGTTSAVPPPAASQPPSAAPAVLPAPAAAIRSTSPPLSLPSSSHSSAPIKHPAMPASAKQTSSARPPASASSKAPAVPGPAPAQ